VLARIRLIAFEVVFVACVLRLGHFDGLGAFA